MSIDNHNPFLNNIKTAYKDNYVLDILNGLLTRMLQNIKVDRAVLILDKMGQLTIEAEASYCNQNGAISKTAYQLRSQSDNKPVLPLSIIRNVFEKDQQLILDNPSQLPEFKGDLYFEAQHPEFIYCSPICSGATVNCGLYLESKQKLLIDDGERETLLALWTDQASLSLENTRWFASLQENLKERMYEISAVRKKNQARNQFLADMNYEVREPLSSIMGFSQLLMKKDSQLKFPADVRRYLENIQSSGNKLVELLDNILEYSRVESGNIDLEKEVIDIKMLINSLFLANRQLLETRRVELQVELDNELPETIFSDRSALTRILRPLLRFCIERSPANKPVILKGSGSGNLFQLTLSDNGSPISPQNRDRLFTAFSSLKNETLNTGEDAKLDLAIAAQLVERLRGSIHYQTFIDGHSEIVVKIPCLTQVNPGDVIGDWKTGKSYSDEKTVLLLEDPLSNWDLLKNMLQDLGVNIKAEKIKPESLPSLIEARPHLMFIDLHMPGMDEKAKIFIRYLRSTPELRNVPLVALTTDKYHKKFQSDYETAKIEFLVKPFGVGNIVEVLKKYLISDRSNKNSEFNKNKKSKTFNYASKMGLSTHLPVNLSKTLKKDLEALTAIPIYKGGTIISRLKQINEEYELADIKFPSLVRNLKSAVYEGNAEKFRLIIKKAIDGKLC